MEVTIFVRALHKSGENKGMAMIHYSLGKHQKELYVCTMCNTLSQSIILGVKVAVEHLKRPCHIRLYTQHNFGFKLMTNQKKWINRAYGDMLHEALVQGGHTISFNDCSNLEENDVTSLAQQKRMDKQMKLLNKKAFEDLQPKVNLHDEISVYYQ